MHQSKRRSGQFVVPGDLLGVIEEFLPGPGTYVKEGTIHSKTSGYMLLDALNKNVSVHPLIRLAAVPRIGSTVIGVVSDTQRKTATLRILKVGKKAISGFFTGVLHISDVGPGYVQTMSDVYKPGDVMRAKVFSTKNGVYHLSTAEKELGAIFAFCSKCGHLLSFNKGKLNCSVCGKTKKRKTTPDYGNEIM